LVLFFKKELLSLKKEAMNVYPFAAALGNCLRAVPGFGAKDIIPTS
jgi:hypothetical protein